MCGISSARVGAVIRRGLHIHLPASASLSFASIVDVGFRPPSCLSRTLPLSKVIVQWHYCNVPCIGIGVKSRNVGFVDQTYHDRQTPYMTIHNTGGEYKGNLISFLSLSTLPVSNTTQTNCSTSLPDSLTRIPRPLLPYGTAHHQSLSLSLRHRGRDLGLPDMCEGKHSTTDVPVEFVTNWCRVAVTGPRSCFSRWHEFAGRRQGPGQALFS